MIARRAFPFILATAAIAFAAPAFAQAYPSRPIHFIMPFPPGPADVTIRLYGQKLSEDWKQPAIVETRTGATGTVGTELAVKAPPDGYTLLFTVDLPITMAPNLLKVPYDPQRDLIPIAAVVESSNVLVVNSASGLRSLADLVAMAKAKPGVLTFSSAGIGSPAHLCGAMIEKQAGIDMIHVPYSGAGPAMNALVAGDVTMFCSPIQQALPFIKAGKLVPLGVAATAESPLLPGVPPLSKTYPGLVLSQWFGLLAPKGTPAAITNALQVEFKRISDEPEIQSKLKAIGLQPHWLDGTELAQRIVSDTAKIRDFMTAAHIHAE
ncbi:MAG TPA: tripartite tricarboxylate transporter substrate binding protein [Xanthobacteraceae bacterium]|nr:tripartite tricarboxylate transporter substrate binding protein [Xanthobacteraceae bacterium]